jgi:hypothetical protein
MSPHPDAHQFCCIEASNLSPPDRVDLGPESTRIESVQHRMRPNRRDAFGVATTAFLVGPALLLAASSAQ